MKDQNLNFSLRKGVSMRGRLCSGVKVNKSSVAKNDLAQLWKKNNMVDKGRLNPCGIVTPWNSTECVDNQLIFNEVIFNGTCLRYCGLCLELSNSTPLGLSNL